MNRRLFALSTLAAVTVAALSGGPAGAGDRRIIDFEEAMDTDCQQLDGPDHFDLGGITEETGTVSLGVLVLVDDADGAAIAQMPVDTADERAAKAAAEQALFDEYEALLAPGVGAYADLDIDLAYDDYALLQPLDDAGEARQRTDHAQEIIDLGKAQLRGARPDGIDVVYVATDLDIQLPGLGNAVAGLADCIGGVADPTRAFAVGETTDSAIPIGPVTFYQDFPAKVAAHEIGHLMGAHHHYQSCGDAAPTAIGSGELGPCTLMTNFVDFLTLQFSVLNGGVVRGHAVDHAHD